MDWSALLGVPIALLAAVSPLVGEWRLSQMLQRDAAVLAALPEGQVRTAYSAQFEERASKLVALRRRKSQPWTLRRWALLMFGLLLLTTGVLMVVVDALGPAKSPLRLGLEFLGTAVATLALLETWRRWVIRRGRALGV